MLFSMLESVVGFETFLIFVTNGKTFGGYLNFIIFCNLVNKPLIKYW